MLTQRMLMGHSSLPYSQVIKLTASAPLQHYWPLNEASGTTAYDKQGSVTGTYQGGYTQYVSAPGSGKGVIFDGSSGYIITSAFTAITSSNMSVEGWFNSDSTSLTGNLFSHNQNSGMRVQLPSYSNGVPVNMIFGGANPLSTTSRYPESAWHHVIAVFGQNGLIIYVDGALAASNTTSFSSAPASAAGYIGQSGYNGEYFPGALTSVAVYGGEVSAADALIHYNAGIYSPG